LTIRSYDLSIISDQEAADRLGVIAAEREDHLDNVVGSTDIPDAAWVMAANRATIALDLLALRKAQVALSPQFRGAVHPFFAGIDPNDHTAIDKKLDELMDAGERSCDLHRKINQGVSNALGQDIGESWHDLGEKVAALKRERDELKERLEDMAIAIDNARARAAGLYPV
jgi:hypothetical protein